MQTNWVEMYEIILSYKNLIYQIIVTLILTLILNYISLSSLFLFGLNTYIHPDDVNPQQKPQSGPKLAIKRPSDPNPSQGINGFQPLSSRTSNELKNRKKIKEKFEFDEQKAQIFRLRLGDAQIQSRLLFNSYKGCFDSFVICCCSLFLDKYLNYNVGNDEINDVGVVKSGTLVPILSGVVGLSRVLISGFRVSSERSAFKRSERQLALVVGVLGFVVALVIGFGVYPGVVDFEFGEIGGFGRLFLALISGIIACFLYMAAGKNARAFWLGTDQIRCSLSIVSSGWLGQIVFYVNYLVVGFVVLLWIKPFGEIFVSKNAGGGRGSLGFGGRDRLVGNMGMAEAEFVKFRLWCSLLSGVMQVVALRLNVQTFLNEAVLSWYQRLHASTVPDMDYSRAKVFLHNHYLCLAVVQFFAPAALILLPLGLSQVDGVSFENFPVLCGILPCSAFFKDSALFLVWWVAFVWFVCTSTYLALYRRGIMYIS